MKKIAVILIWIFASTALKAQDVHWAQPSNALLYQNPAFTGISNKFSTGVNYRNQWNALGTSYNSYMLNGDYRFGKISEPNVALSMGAIVFSDVAGDGNYRTTNAGLTLSCLVKLNKTLKLGGGLGYNLVQKTLQADKYTWGAQYDGQAYNPALTNGEGNLTSAKTVSDLNAGISLAFDKSAGSFAAVSNSKFIMGYSISHLNRPNLAMNSGKDLLNIKHTVFMTGLFSLKDNVALKPTALFYLQGPLMEITAGCLVRYSLGQQSKITGIKKGSAIGLGALYRVNDAIIPTMEFEKGTWLFGLSYDVNVSGLSAMSKLRGGIELSARLVNFGDYLYRNKR